MHTNDFEATPERADQYNQSKRLDVQRRASAENVRSNEQR